jgi:hypothetical protein
MTMNDRYLPLPDRLPEGFRFPATYVEIAGSEALPDIEPWWWLSIREQSYVFWMEKLAEQFPDRLLVPFAKMEDSDDLACFDGADQSGQPKVLYIHAYTTAGWEHRGDEASFEVWLSKALVKAD